MDILGQATSIISNGLLASKSVISDACLAIPNKYLNNLICDFGGNAINATFSDLSMAIRHIPLPMINAVSAYIATIAIPFAAWSFLKPKSFRVENCYYNNVGYDSKKASLIALASFVASTATCATCYFLDQALNGKSNLVNHDFVIASSTLILGALTISTVALVSGKRSCENLVNSIGGSIFSRSKQE